MVSVYSDAYLIIIIIILLSALLYQYKQSVSPTQYTRLTPSTESVPLVDPSLIPPTRIYPTRFPVRIPINIITQGGIQPFFQRIGIVFQQGATEDTRTILQLFGRPTYYGSNKYEYYVENNGIKIPLTEIKKELETDQHLSIPGYVGEFTVLVYDYDVPRYIPL